MKRLRSFLPILILIAIGIALLWSGALNRFKPENLAHEQAALQAQIALHPILAALIHVGVVTLSISTGIPGVVVLIFAGGMLFGIVYGTILIPQVILFEAALSFLGIGIDPGTPSWGSMISDAVGVFDIAWWFMTFPGLALVLTVLAFNLVGDGLQDALNPRTAK